MKIPAQIQNDAVASEIYLQTVASLGTGVDDGVLLIVTVFAETASLVQQLKAEIAAEGPTYTRPSGLQLANPKVRLLNATKRQVLSFAKSLGLTPGSHVKSRRPASTHLVRNLLGGPARDASQLL